MKANVLLTEKEVQLIFEALTNLSYEYDRARQETPARTLRQVKEKFITKKNDAKNLLKRLKNCTGKINYLLSI